MDADDEPPPGLSNICNHNHPEYHTARSTLTAIIAHERIYSYINSLPPSSDRSTALLNTRTSLTCILRSIADDPNCSSTCKWQLEEILTKVHSGKRTVFSYERVYRVYRSITGVNPELLASEGFAL